MIYAMEAFKFILLLLYPQKKKKKNQKHWQELNIWISSFCLLAK